MNDRYMEALEQYEPEAVSVRRGRGAWICETETGWRILKEYRGTVKRLEFEDQVLNTICLEPGIQVDHYIHNKEGSLLSIAGDGHPLCDERVVSGTGMRLEESGGAVPGCIQTGSSPQRFKDREAAGGMEFGLNSYRASEG